LGYRSGYERQRHDGDTSHCYNCPRIYRTPARGLMDGWSGGPLDTGVAVCVWRKVAQSGSRQKRCLQNQFSSSVIMVHSLKRLQPFSGILARLSGEMQVAKVLFPFAVLWGLRRFFDTPAMVAFAETGNGYGAKLACSITFGVSARLCCLAPMIVICSEHHD
jgi:hypothetical protein